MATVGTNSVDDIVLAALEDVQGTPFRAVPYSEPGERYTALLSGEVDALYEQLGDVTSFLDSGDFVPVVIFADEPVKGFEDVPLASDLDLPDEVVLPQFRGLVTSAEATDSVVQQLSDSCGEAMKAPEVAGVPGPRVRRPRQLPGRGGVPGVPGASRRSSSPPSWTSTAWWSEAVLTCRDRLDRGAAPAYCGMLVEVTAT